jgi:3-oxoacyl-[acyl-carrier protein] reductase
LFAAAHKVSGAHCTLIARNEETLKEAVKKLDTSLQQQHHYLLADFSKPGEVKKTIEAYTAANTVHILINNTGGPAAGPITEATEDAFINTFNQHLICNHVLAKACIPSMKKEGYGRIVNVISTSVKIPLKNLGVSNTIRGAVASWAKTLSNEVGQFNITVNNVLPGFTSTNRLTTLIDNIAKKGNTVIDIVEKNMLEEVPMKRFADASEVAAVAAFLASPAASYVNGVSIPVDGGRTGSI